MIEWRKDGSAFQIQTGTYSLRTAADRPYLALAAGGTVTDLCTLFSAHPLDGRDDTTWLGDWQVEQAGSELLLMRQAGSSCWENKRIIFRCSEQRLSCEVEVAGRGRLVEVTLLGGYYSGHVRWGSGFFWSGQRFRQGFTPEPNSAEQIYFPAAAGAAINLYGVPLPGKADWFFTPPPFFLAFELEQGWLGMGIAARPGHNRFSEFRYHAQPGAFTLSLAFDGRTEVKGVYTLPSVIFDFGSDPYTTLGRHIEGLTLNSGAPGSALASQPVWWREPLFCGWGSQCYRAALEGRRAPDLSRQELYEAWLQRLEAERITPGTVVIDDKWQASYGNNDADPLKWPDLPGFVARQHRLGRRVLLWLKAWDPEGLPPQECIRNAAGLSLSFDPTHPDFAARLRRSVRRMLAEDSYGADGFKIDFTARIPTGPALQSYGDAWGLELMKAYLDLLHGEAHRVKPDALVITHTPHPYLAGVLDMIRLNDINTGTDIPAAMTHRARVASLACPQTLIDTDNWPVTDKASWREYTLLQPQLGVPSLYFAEGVDTTREPFGLEDYHLIREVWQNYRGQR